MQKICDEIIAVKPDLVITEKGLSGWANFVLARWPVCGDNSVVLV